MMNRPPPLLRVTKLQKHFLLRKEGLRSDQQTLKAVDSVSFDLAPRQTLGLVGESGCGKTTVGRSIMQLIRPTSGDVRLGDSPNLATLSSKQMLPYRRRMQMIFQDPYSSLNPRMTIGATIAEAFTIHRLAKGRETWERVAETLRSVGLDPSHIRRYPHEFSGGQRQRIGIARALAVQPEAIIADEPVSALDVSIQAQIINLLQSIQETRGVSFVFISHDLSVVGHISHRVAVMYLGNIVEIGPKQAVFDNPLHPYTRALMAAAPSMDRSRRKGRGNRQKGFLQGDVPSPVNPPSGCAFHPRCPEASEKCTRLKPRLSDQGQGHAAACLLYPDS